MNVVYYKAFLAQGFGWTGPTTQTRLHLHLHSRSQRHEPPAKRTRVHHMAGRVWICGGIIGHAGRGVERVRDPPQRHPRRVSKVEGTELWVRLMIHVTRYSFEVK